MSFFQQIRNEDASAPVTIKVNEETVTLTADNYRGKSLSQLAAEYASSMIDVARINRYIVDGVARSGDTVIRPGETLQLTVNSESKGA